MTFRNLLPIVFLSHVKIVHWSIDVFYSLEGLARLVLLSCFHFHFLSGIWLVITYHSAKGGSNLFNSSHTFLKGKINTCILRTLSPLKKNDVFQISFDKLLSLLKFDIILQTLSELIQKTICLKNCYIDLIKNILINMDHICIGIHEVYSLIE